MKVNKQPRFLTDDRLLQQEFQDHATLLNLLTEGRLAGTNYTATAAPTSGMHAQGDFVRNSAPTELGTAGSKYVVLGWICLGGGTPGTFVGARVLTGN